MSKWVKLKEVAEYSLDRIQSANVAIEDYVTIDCMEQNKCGISIPANFPPTDCNFAGYQPGDTLIGNIRPYLKKIWFANKSGGCSTDVLCVRANETVDSKYLYYALSADSFFEYAMNGAVGSKMPRGSKAHIMDYLIRNIALPTQQKIAAVLSSLDAKIELNNRIITELEQMAKSLYDYWFVQFDFPDAQGKPYRSSGGVMVWNEKLKREIPEGWEVKSLDQIADFTNGLACQKNRPKDGDSGLRVIKIREMHGGFTLDSEFVKSDIPNKVKVFDGDVLFSWSASLEVMIWAYGNGGLNQHIFKVTSTKYPRSFYYFHLLDYVEHFKKIAEARKTTMGHITKEHIEQSTIVVPHDDLIIISLENEINPIFEKVVLLQQENQELTTLRDWLLPMLMNGQVEVE